MYSFLLGPFRFESEFDIAELRDSTGPASHSVNIRLGDLPISLQNSKQVSELCQFTATEYLLRIPGIARYYVRDGKEVRIEVTAGAPARDVSTYLLGSIFGVLCHQNRMLPLHASAVESGGAVTAFLGDSGAGKSTLAACLQRRGHRIVSDDICLLEPEPGGEMFHVEPVAGWLKLWDNSFQHLGEQPLEQNRIFSEDNKFRLYLPDATENAGPLRLRRVVFLSRSKDPDAVATLEPVALLDAIAGLMDMTYAGYVPESSGQTGRLFQQCARALNGVQSWRLTVPWSLDRMDATLDLLESEFFYPSRV